MSELLNQNLFSDIKELINASRNKIVQTVNTTMVYTYFEIGRLIVEDIQKGEDRASYGKQVLKLLSEELVREFGNGFSERNLLRMKNFYQEYSISPTLSSEFKTLNSSIHSRISENQKSQTLSAKFILSWSHYVFLMRIDNPDERRFYEIEAFENNWSLRELKRQFDSSLYERLALSRDKESIKKLSENGQLIENPKDIIKDPYILEFLGLPENERYSEGDLENRIISKLEHFLLELGKGFTFVARQKRITYNEKHFFIDLVFYNRLLKAFVIIDLKIGEIKHQDLGQMQMYVNYYDREVKLDDENKTIGIIICKQKDNALVEMTLPEDNKQIFASKYDLFLPDKQELKKLIEETE
ncbi:MAG: PDDEXK nuclease domain-containing protein [Candidatus Cloacimonetes bacterium]|nr:PDDEXK nuclease domain-containing protein [Candidatus Cloacimonadota bacterium]